MGVVLNEDLSKTCFRTSPFPQTKDIKSEYRTRTFLFTILASTFVNNSHENLMTHF